MYNETSVVYPFKSLIADDRSDGGTRSCLWLCHLLRYDRGETHRFENLLRRRSLIARAEQPANELYELRVDRAVITAPERTNNRAKFTLLVRVETRLQKRDAQQINVRTDPAGARGGGARMFRLLA